MAEQARARAHPRWLTLALALLVTVAAVAWLAGTLDWERVVATLRGADYGLVALALLTVLLTIGARALRWAVLVRPLRPRPLDLLSALVTGQLVNYLIPARAGDLARGFLLGQGRRDSGMRLVGTVAAEKVWDLLTALLLVLVLGLTMDLPRWVTVALPGLAALALAALVGAWVSRRWKGRMVALVAALEARLPLVPQGLLSRAVARLLDGLGGLQRAGLAWRALALSALVWGLGILGNLLVLRAVGIAASPALAAFLMVVLMLGISVPTLPAQMGAFEGLCVISLGLWGVGRDVAFSAGLLLHAVVYLPPVLLALALGPRTWGRLGHLPLRGQRAASHEGASQ